VRASSTYSRRNAGVEGQRGSPSKHHDRVADADLRMPDHPAGVDHPAQFLGAERLSEVVDDRGRVTGDDPQRDGRVALGDRLDGHVG
jgi:hypothetical protein